MHETTCFDFSGVEAAHGVLEFSSETPCFDFARRVRVRLNYAYTCQDPGGCGGAIDGSGNQDMKLDFPCEGRVVGDVPEAEGILQGGADAFFPELVVVKNVSSEWVTFKVNNFLRTGLPDDCDKVCIPRAPFSQWLVI